MADKVIEVRCPTCNKVIRTSGSNPLSEAKYFPFCSQRCKLVDLGHWLDGDYKITTELPCRPLDEPDGDTPDARIDKR
jgi:endogenous inhibitor of DNA gyrase (YacG/DUF329 family)